jgi:tRNA(adenine34) deaminase
MSYPLFSDEYFMNEALKEAQKALSMNEVPVGAIIVAENTIIARAHNSTETLIDVTAHAEIIAITSASNHLGAKYLTHATLYVTLEPCVMCAGACHWAQVARLVYGAPDTRAGYTRIIQDILHPKTSVTTGVLKAESEKMLKAFFREKR